MESLSAVSAGGGRVPRLDGLASEAYLALLQDAAYIYIQLTYINSAFLRNVRSSILPTLKKQLTHLSGTMSSSIRQDLVNKIISGKYQSFDEYRNQYNKICDDVDELDQALSEMKRHGSKCSSLCCTAAFVPEIMLSVVVNEDLREINLPDPDNTRYGLTQRNPILRDFVGFQLPIVLSHYAKAVRSAMSKGRSLQLQKLVVPDAGERSNPKDLSVRRKELLKSFDETRAYLDLPGKLDCQVDPGPPWVSQGMPSEDGEDEDGYFSSTTEVLMKMFGAGNFVTPFEKLTEIRLGGSWMVSGVYVHFDYPWDNPSHDSPEGSKFLQWAEIFSGIGHGCVNLKVLDVSDLEGFPPNLLLEFMFMRAFDRLHQFCYLPHHFERQGFVELCYSGVYGYSIKSSADVWHHSDVPTKYCPWCLDDWGSAMKRVPPQYRSSFFKQLYPVDDFVYEAVLKDKGPHYLSMVIKASDVIKAVDTPMLTLVRPEGPTPFDKDFVPPPKEDYTTDEMDADRTFYKPKNVQYKPRKHSRRKFVNKAIMKSLQQLKLPAPLLDNISTKTEIIPVLLALFPKLKCLGRGNVVQAYKRYRHHPNMASIEPNQLEQLNYRLPTVSPDPKKIQADLLWCDPAIRRYVAGLYYERELSRLKDMSPKEALVTVLKDDMIIIRDKFCAIQSLNLDLVSMVDDSEILRDIRTQVWSVFEDGGLQRLKSLKIIADVYPLIHGLLEIIGRRLRLLDAIVFKRHDDEGISSTDMPTVDKILDVCPNLESLTVNGFPPAIDLSNPLPDSLRSLDPLPSITSVKMRCEMTVNAFKYMWARSTNLASFQALSVGGISDAILPGLSRPVHYWTERELSELFRVNRMQCLKRYEAMTHFSSVHSALAFLLALPAEGIEVVSSLHVRIEDHMGFTPEQNPVVAPFMEEVATRKRKGQKIVFTWDRDDPWDD